MLIFRPKLGASVLSLEGSRERFFKTKQFGQVGVISIVSPAQNWRNRLAFSIDLRSSTNRMNSCRLLAFASGARFLLGIIPFSSF